MTARPRTAATRLERIRDLIAYRTVNFILRFVATQKYRTAFSNVMALGLEAAERRRGRDVAVEWDEKTHSYLVFVEGEKTK